MEGFQVSKRIAAIVFIWFCTTIAWIVLGETIFSRTYSSDEKLQSRVGSTWGTKQEQGPPRAHYLQNEPRQVEIENNGKKTVRTEYVTTTYSIPLESSQISVDLNLSHRQKGLLWYSTYAVKFAGVFGFTNNTSGEQMMTFSLPFPAQQAVYDGLTMDVNGQPLSLTTNSTSAWGQHLVKAGETAILHVGYRSQGMEAWNYKLGDDIAEARNFQLNMATDFKDIDFANNTLSPTEKHQTARGWELTWKYVNLLS